LILFDSILPKMRVGTLPLSVGPRKIKKKQLQASN
jgi:hypothetical protein